MDISFSPLETFRRALQYWWLVFLLMVLGGLIGWAIHLLKPPVYEASAVITFAIDYGQTGQLTDVEEDQMLGLAGDVIASPLVINRVFDKAQQEGLKFDAAVLKKSIFPERQDYKWILHVRLSDPQAAARISGLWAEEAYAVLSDALYHATTASKVQKYMDGLVSCLQQTVVTQPSQALCDLELSKIQQNLSDAGKQLHQEQLASLGVLPALRFAEPAIPEMPTTSIQNGRNQLVFAGAIVGFLVGILCVYLDIPGYLLRKRAG
jgi:hypothetical protein